MGKELFKEFTDLKDMYEKKIQEFGTEVFVDFFKDFFEKFPYVDKVRWTQYTPSFNDGNPCVFHVTSEHIKLTSEFGKAHPVLFNEEDPAAEEGDDGQYPEGALWTDGGFYGHDSKKDPEGLKMVNDAMKAFREVVYLEDVVQQVFGDGYTITASKEGLESEECYHD